MRLLTLCYHDILQDGGAERSGFSGPDAATYKLSVARFREHLQALREHAAEPRFAVRFTFDDGGLGAMHAADALEEYGCRGSFFITTALLGTSGFLDDAQVAELSGRGHAIGSHGVTHRGSMSRMPDEQLKREWTESVLRLAEITGASITTASVPSGRYAKRVARIAAAAGIRQLFTQRPTTREGNAFGCEVLGRFTMRAWTPAARVAALARGEARPRLEDAFWWRVRELAKAVGGSAYRDVRRAWFERISSAASIRP